MGYKKGYYNIDAVVYHQKKHVPELEMSFRYGSKCHQDFIEYT